MPPTLNDIDWANIHHSHGTAEKFPLWIAALSADDRRQQKRALRNIGEYSLHQGTLYEVTPIVIPFVAEVLMLPPRPFHADVLYLVGEYARCSLLARTYTPELSAASYRAASHALPRILHLCRHPQGVIRKAAFNALCQFEPSTHPAIQPTIYAVVTQEADPLIQNMMAMDLMHRYEERGADPNPRLADLLPILTDLMQASRPAPTRALAALTTIGVQGEVTPPAVISTLIEAIADADVHRPQRPTISILFTIEYLPIAQSQAILAAALAHATDIIARGQLALSIAHITPKGAPAPTGVVEALAEFLPYAGQTASGEAQTRRYLDAWRSDGSST